MRKDISVHAKYATPTSLALAKAIAQWAFDKKAEDVIILDMRKVVNYCDYFVICSGSSDKQIKAICEGIEESLNDCGLKVYRKHGLSDAVWGLMDMGDVVVHVFQKAVREFYGLEYLWQEAKKVKWVIPKK